MALNPSLVTLQITSGVALWAREWGPQLRNSISKEAPKKTGRLKASIRYTTGLDPLGYALQIHSNAKYAQYVEHGTKGGQTIVPVSRQILHWGGSPGTFANQVTRGSTPANQYVERGYDNVKDDMNKALLETVATGLASTVRKA